MRKKNWESYAPTFQAVIASSDKEQAEQIKAEADKRYTAFLMRHTDLHGAAAMHWKQCCERAALYSAIKDCFPGQAYEWIEHSTKAHGEKVGASIDKSLRFPGMKHLFIPIMKKVAKGMFGEKAGFVNKTVESTQGSIHFDILDCPYCRYLSELGCPELTESFCKSDEYAYGNLKLIAFKRTQTLGTGGDKCDFYMSVK